MAENKIINFNLLKIKTDQYAVFEENFDLNGIIDLNTKLSFGLNQDDKVFLVIPKYTFEIEGKPFMTIQISCFFKIEDRSWERFKKKKEIIFPKEFVTHMAMITVGTSRGILHSKTENTKFNELILPTLNVVEMIPEDIIFNI
jgi:hypothetical protein